jgi:hypothetical protein
MARKVGVYKGRKPSLTAEHVKEVRKWVSGQQKIGLALEFKVSRQMLLLSAGLMPGSESTSVRVGLPLDTSDAMKQSVQGRAEGALPQPEPRGDDRHLSRGIELH